MTRPGGAPAETGRRVLYGRRKGRPLRPGRLRLVEEMLPALRVPLPASGGRIDLSALFPAGLTEYRIEIGFGAGEHLAAEAAASPRAGIIGCEPYLNGVAALLALLAAAAAAGQSADNVRIHPDDARPLLEALPDGCLSRVTLLFPDPWPKKRQFKRRFVCAGNLEVLARVMQDGGELRLATDHEGYLEWIREHLAACPAFAGSGEILDRRPQGWAPTRYETRARRQGGRCTWLRYRRRDRVKDRAGGPDGA